MGLKKSNFLSAIHFQSLLSLLLILTFSWSVCALKYDATLIDGAQGKDVVEAVLRHIESSNIFPDDHSFLARIAFVETEFGKKNLTFRPQSGGIWLVDEDKFELLHHSSLWKLHAAIKEEFGIDWSKILMKDLKKPLYCGLAASLYLSYITKRYGTPIPDTIVGQASFWKLHHRPEGDINRFIQESRRLRDLTVCEGKMDLCIVLDSSGSINAHDNLNYQRAKNFTADLIESFTLKQTRIGMVIYSHETEDVFPIRNELTIKEMARLARRAKYLNSGTLTDIGIQRAIEMFEDAGVVKGVPRLIFIFTDGNANDAADLPKAVKSMKENSITPVSVGIGEERMIKTEELLLLALNNPRMVFRLGEFEALHDFIYKIRGVACEAHQTMTEERTTTDILKKEERRYYEMSVPQEGITVRLDVEEGRTKGYWSYTEKVPSSAIHDGVIDEEVFYIPYPGDYNPRRDKRQIHLRRAKREIAPEGDSTNVTSSTFAAVYLAIEGLEENNNYTLTVENGNSAPCSGDQFICNMTSWSVACSFLVFLMFAVFCCKFCKEK